MLAFPIGNRHLPIGHARQLAQAGEPAIGLRAWSRLASPYWQRALRYHDLEGHGTAQMRVVRNPEALSSALRIATQNLSDRARLLKIGPAHCHRARQTSSDCAGSHQLLRK